MPAGAGGRSTFVGVVTRGGQRLRVRDPIRGTTASVLPPRGAVRPGAVVEVRSGREGLRAARVLAAAGSARAALYAIALERGLDPTFPDEVEREVAALGRSPGIDDPSLKDLRKLPFVTIDGPGTRDLDQALCLRRDGDDIVVSYALADPSWCVRPGTALFAESLRRGASFYLPGLSVPMLPRALSEGIVSLNAGVDRRALVFVMRVDPEGQCTETTLVRARIHSRGQLTFAVVQAFLDDPKGHPLGDRATQASLRLLPEVAHRRMRDAARRHVVRYRREEVDVKLDGQAGLRFSVLAAAHTEVEGHNEQLSLLCNIEGARLLRAGGRQAALVQPIYRVHPAPAPARYDELERLIEALCQAHGLDPRTWRWRRRDGQPLAEYLHGLPSRGAHGRVARAIHRQAILLNVRSTFSAQEGAHFGVGAEVYARFSAPMREVVGVFLHKEIWEHVTGRSDGESADDEALRVQVVAAANRSKQVQRDVTKRANELVLDQLFGDDLAQPVAQRPVHAATVMGIDAGKVHVSLDRPAIDVKIYTRHLEALLGSALAVRHDGAELHAVRGGRTVCRIGDAIRVQVRGRERGAHRYELALV